MATKAGDMILWVDDDLRSMYGYINEVRLNHGTKYFIDFVTTVDKGFAQFKKLQEACVGVILDIMMPPGILFKDHKRGVEGLRTGILLYELIRTLDPKIPVLFLSNVTDQGVIADLNSRPATKFVSKSETPPSGLSDELKTFFKLS